MDGKLSEGHIKNHRKASLNPPINTRGGFRRVEFEFEVKTDEKQAPEVKH